MTPSHSHEVFSKIFKIQVLKGVDVKRFTCSSDNLKRKESMSKN